MRNDDEKELVLGNKQLLSLFFVAAVLCGVCFAIGYMVGRNTSKATAVTTDPVVAASIEGRRQQPDAPPQLPSAEPQSLAPGETKPALDPAASAPPPAPEPKPTRPPEPDPLPVETPETGTSYLQVAALPRPEAEKMVQTLRDERLPVIMALSPKPGFFRVLVGPYRQTVQLSDAKTKLKNLGFNSAFVQKQ